MNSTDGNGRLGRLYDYITGDEDARVCKEIPDAARRQQPRNFFAYLTANLLNKVADELTSAKLVLPWLLGALGTPVLLSGFPVPIRESGVLLPQLMVAAKIVMTILHAGGRLGRKIYLADMATGNNRAAYVALSNTVIGVAMLGAGVSGLIGDWLGLRWLILLLALASLVAAVHARQLAEVSG